ncbi:hypothetical protein ACFQV2_13595 [Actinokineospora soli]|uniref:Uncharacterized protein n=1 Tax=Actinokineospora soli TaxID=1048753 RepID=A0ABW2TKX9_9PSEU
MTRFEVITGIAAPPQRVFDVSLEVELHTASMADSGERAIGGVTSGRMELGDTVTWQAKHFGLRWRMTSSSAPTTHPPTSSTSRSRAPSNAGTTPTTSSQTATAAPSCATSSTSPPRSARSAP